MTLFLGTHATSPIHRSEIDNALAVSFTSANRGSFVESADGSSYSFEMGIDLPALTTFTAGQHAWVCLYDVTSPGSTVAPLAVLGPFTVLS